MANNTMSWKLLDPRKEEFVQGRSINLAMSVRGVEALKGVGAHLPVGIFKLSSCILIIIIINRSNYRDIIQLYLNHHYH